MKFQIIGDLCETPYSYFPNIHGQCLEGILFLDFETDKKQIVHAYANFSYNLFPNTQLIEWNGSETRQTPLLYVFVDLKVHNVQKNSYHFDCIDQ